MTQAQGVNTLSVGKGEQVMVTMENEGTVVHTYCERNIRKLINLSS